MVCNDCGAKDLLPEDEDNMNLLREAVEHHEHGECPCDTSSDSAYGLCIAGEYLEGCISRDEALAQLQ